MKIIIFKSDLHTRKVNICLEGTKKISSGTCIYIYIPILDAYLYINIIIYLYSRTLLNIIVNIVIIRISDTLCYFRTKQLLEYTESDLYTYCSRTWTIFVICDSLYIYRYTRLNKFEYLVIIYYKSKLYHNKR